MRLVKVEHPIYTIYEGKRLVIQFRAEEGQEPLDAEQIEDLRVADYSNEPRVA